MATSLSPFAASRSASVSSAISAMNAATVTASAPGSLMISGEHAVLHNRHALAGAVDQRIHVNLRPRDDDEIHIVSELGERRMPLTDIDRSPPFRFVGAAIEQSAERLPSGIDLTIQSDFPPDIGLGSSAAVTVATMAAIDAWRTPPLDATNGDGGPPPFTPPGTNRPPTTASEELSRESLLRRAVTLIRDVQGLGSGTDVAAAVYGGIVRYKASPPKVVERFDDLPDICLVYAGYKTPTPEVVRMVEQRRRESPGELERAFDLMEACTAAAAEAIRNRDWAALGEALATGQEAMVAMGVCDSTLAATVAGLLEDDGILGAKISGSGLGDCVLGIRRFGDVPLHGNATWPYRAIPVTLSGEGVSVVGTVKGTVKKAMKRASGWQCTREGKIKEKD